MCNYILGNLYQLKSRQDRCYFLYMQMKIGEKRLGVYRVYINTIKNEINAPMVPGHVDGRWSVPLHPFIPILIRCIQDQWYTRLVSETHNLRHFIQCYISSASLLNLKSRSLQVNCFSLFFSVFVVIVLLYVFCPHINQNAITLCTVLDRMHVAHLVEYYTSFSFGHVPLNFVIFAAILHTW